MDANQKIADFLAGEAYAVAGASRDRSKYGNRALRCYQQNDRRVYPVHPREDEIEGVACLRDYESFPEPVHGLSIITPPEVTEGIVELAAAAGIERVWMQPGAESPTAVARAEELGMTVIAGGPCVLVALGFRE